MRLFFLVLIPSLSHAFIQPVPSYPFEEPLAALPDYNFFFSFLCSQIAAFYGVGSLLGFWREKSGVRTGFTRKIFCMIFFALSFIIPWLMPADGIKAGTFLLATTTLTVLLISSLSRPLRKRFPPSRLVFSAISREGEHSQTLYWLASEAVITSLVIYVGAHFLNNVSPLLLLLPAFASGLGDAAAEIVGTRWGKHHYRTSGFFVEKSFTRSLEGSLAFFLVTALSSGVLYFFMPYPMRPAELACLIVLPFVLTVAEAIAPHSWDNPVTYTAGYLAIAFLS